MSETRGEVALATDEELRSESLAVPWREFAEARSNPFLTPEWTHSWLSSHPHEESFALTWRKGGVLRGVLPLVRARMGPFGLLRFAGARRADWISPACLPEDEPEMALACGAFLAAEKRWHLLRLDRLEQGSAFEAALHRPAAEGLPLAGPEWKRNVLPYVEFDRRGYEGYLEDRSRNFRSQLGRRRRRLERDHGLTFRITETADDLPADLDWFFRLHDERWERRGGSSSKDRRARDHIRLFAEKALARGWLRLWIAEADGAPAAAWYGWRIGRRYCYALAGLAREFEKLALGTVLLGHTIEQAAAEGATIYDFMWGDEDYKRRFETGRRHASTVLLAKPHHPARLLADSGVRLARAAEGMPPGIRKPISSALRLAGRT